MHKHKGRKRLSDRYFVDNTIAYGKPNRPHTPMGGLISNAYGEIAENRIKSRYEFHSQKVRGQYNHICSVMSQNIKSQSA